MRLPQDIEMILSVRNLDCVHTQLQAPSRKANAESRYPEQPGKARAAPRS